MTVNFTVIYSCRVELEFLWFFFLGLGVGKLELVCTRRNQEEEEEEGMERVAVRRGRGWRCRCERAIGCGGGQRCTGERICTIQGTSGSRRPRARPGLPLLRLPKCCVFALPTKMSVLASFYFFIVDYRFFEAFCICLFLIWVCIEEEPYVVAQFPTKTSRVQI